MPGNHKCKRCTKPMTRVTYKEEVDDDPKREHLIKVKVSYTCRFCGNDETYEYYRHRRTKRQ